MAIKCRAVLILKGLKIIINRDIFLITEGRTLSSQVYIAMMLLIKVMIFKYLSIYLHISLHWMQWQWQQWVHESIWASYSSNFNAEWIRPSHTQLQPIRGQVSRADNVFTTLSAHLQEASFVCIICSSVAVVYLATVQTQLCGKKITDS